MTCYLNLVNSRARLSNTEFMQTPTPPDGYRLVKGEEIKDCVPEGAQVWTDANMWRESLYEGDPLPSSNFKNFYAIPDSQKSIKMNKTYTLKELADIGAKASLQHITGTYAAMAVSDRSSAWERERPAREAFTKAILDAIGYQLPKDEEREAFEKWYECAQTFGEAKEVIFASWKAGREELRKSQSLDKQPGYSMPPSYAGITLLGTKPNEPEWIPWNGGKCPLSDKVKKWEYKMRNGWCLPAGVGSPKFYRWNHVGSDHDIIAYRVWE